MAKLMLLGDSCGVRLFSPGQYDDEHEETYVAYCETHKVVGEYDTLDDAAEYSQAHADYGR